MSKVRRENHKDLVVNNIIYKSLFRAMSWYQHSPRWRQREKAKYERIFKK